MLWGDTSFVKTNPQSRCQFYYLAMYDFSTYTTGQCHELIDANAFRLNNVIGEVRTRRKTIFDKAIQIALFNDN